jgi:ribosomal protein S12 methylthiotransferase accessory factor
MIEPASCLGHDALLDSSLAAGEVGSARWHLSLLTMDVEIPILAAALIDADGRRPMTSMGVAADLDPVRGLLLAVEEALLTRVLLARSSELRDTKPPSATTLRGHMLAHAHSGELRRELRFITDAPETVTLPDVEARFLATGSSLIRRLSISGATAWYVDVSTADVALAGFRVVRTVIPGMQPLDNDHRHRYLGGRRLTDAPRLIGADPAAVDKRNPYPHPFP